jgi:hypothetical protein
LRLMPMVRQAAPLLSPCFMSLMYSVRLTVCGDAPGPVRGLRLPTVGNS